MDYSVRDKVQVMVVIARGEAQASIMSMGSENIYRTVVLQVNQHLYSFCIPTFTCQVCKMCTTTPWAGVVCQPLHWQKLLLFDKALLPMTTTGMFHPFKGVVVTCTQTYSSDPTSYCEATAHKTGQLT